MKKIFMVALLVIAMLFSLTGCAKSDFDMYSDAFKSLNDTNAIDASGKLQIKASMENVDMTIPIDFDIKLIRNTDGDVVMYMGYSMSFMGSDTDITLYVIDGVTYTATTTKYDSEEYTVKIKTEGDDSDMTLPEFDKSQVDMNPFKEEDFADIEREEVDGGYKYTIVKTAAQVREYLDNLVEQILSAATDMTEEEKNDARAEAKKELDEANIGDMTITFVIKDDNFVQISVSLQANSDDEFIGEARLDITLELTINATGDSVSIDTPDDLDEYLSEDDYLDDNFSLKNLL